jgi:hypothetical protein
MPHDEQSPFTPHAAAVIAAALTRIGLRSPDALLISLLDIVARGHSRYARELTVPLMPYEMAHALPAGARRLRIFASQPSPLAPPQCPPIIQYLTLHPRPPHQARQMSLACSLL